MDFIELHPSVWLHRPSGWMILKTVGTVVPPRWVILDGDRRERGQRHINLALQKHRLIDATMTHTPNCGAA